jgi:hypothetical protein
MPIDAKSLGNLQRTDWDEGGPTSAHFGGLAPILQVEGIHAECHRETYLTTIFDGSSMAPGALALACTRACH